MAGWLFLAVAAGSLTGIFPDKKQVCLAGNFCIAGFLFAGSVRFMCDEEVNRYICPKFRHV
jgi:hypothetical protein